MSLTRQTLEGFAQAYREACGNMKGFRKVFKTYRHTNKYCNQMGLFFHDVIPSSSIVRTAVKRLPRELAEARDFRISRASHLAAARSILPREQWVKMEEDIPYLTPFMEIVMKENHDRTSWDYFADAQEYDHTADKI